jgi:uncharacterized protein (TIGR02001 family)
MSFKYAGLAGAILLVAQGAQAEVSVTATAVSDYVFRGVSQTAEDPALQISIDWTTDMFYASMWGSNVDFGDNTDANVEVDFVAGLAGEFGDGWRWDVGATWYTYPGSGEDLGKSDDETDDVFDVPNYYEAFAGGGYGPVDVKVWYSWDLYDTDESAWYTEANATFPLPWWELGVDLHVGYSFGDYFDSLDPELGDNADDWDLGASGDYWDFSAALTRSFGDFDFALMVTTTDTDSGFDVDGGPLSNDTQFVFKVATTFPWTKDEAAPAPAAAAPAVGAEAPAVEATEAKETD